MHILIGVAASVALLYFWLSGHWFARVLMFLLLLPVLGFFFANLGPPSPGAQINQMGLVIGLLLAWPISRLPLYYYRSIVRGHEAALKRQATAR